MDARDVEQAEDRLRGFGERGLAQLAAGVLALTGAVAAPALAPSLAIPIFVAGTALACLGAAALVRRSFLLDDLVTDRDAYAIGGVRLHALRAASTDHRRRAAESVRMLLEAPPSGLEARVEHERPLLEELADELADDTLPLDPRCAVELERLLEGRTLGALYDAGVPAADLHAALIRILGGFAQRPAA